MELFIPSLLALIFAAVIVMFVLPRLSPVILGVVALVLLILAAYQHYNLFATEYRLSTWQMPLVEYAPFLLIGGLVLFLLFFILNFIGTGAKESVAPLESMNEAVNKVVNTIPTPEQALNTVKNAANNALRAVGLAGPNTGVNTNTTAVPRGNVVNNRGNRPNTVRFSQI